MTKNCWIEGVDRGVNDSSLGTEPNNNRLTGRHYKKE